MWICASCDRESEQRARVCLACGCDALLRVTEEGDEEDGDEAIPRGEKLSALKPLEVVRVEAPIASALAGGFPREGAFVAVSGRRGAGKSTEVLRAAIAMGEPAVLWLDGEQQGAELASIGARLELTEREKDRVRRVDVQGWSVAAVTRVLRSARARVIVIDSLQAIARLEHAQAPLLEALKSAAKARKVLFVISHVSRAGEPFGSSLIEPASNACVRVTKRAVIGTKCRWGLESRARRPSAASASTSA